MERHYAELEAALDFAPREPITVILYPAQEFQDITRVPSWAGALNDGKIRIPVHGLSSMTLALSRILKHEMVHSFVHSEVQGRCPTWFNEGLAQFESGETAPSSLLAPLYAASRQVPLAQLEGSFLQFDTSLAAVAYAESETAVEVIHSKYGDYSLAQILKMLGEGKSMREALQQILRGGYPELETALREYTGRTAR